VGVAAGAQSATFGTGTNTDAVILGLMAMTATPSGPDFSISASPGSQSVVQGGSVPYTASVGALNGFSGTVSFSVTGLPSGATSSFVPVSVTGSGSSTLTVTTSAGTPVGTYTLTITGTGPTSTHSVNVTFITGTTPAITSANNATFTVGTAGSFTVTATGSPTPSLTETGALPSGVTFVNNGNGTATLAGTPASGTAGSYPITITANNGVGSPANQNFTLTVGIAQTPPAITSTNSAIFTVGTAGSFTVTATGSPIPSLTETGALPSGVTFVNNGNGTATLAGTPASGTAGSYAITITANNGVGSPANQNFTLSVSGGVGGVGPSNFAYVAGSVTGAFSFSGSSTTLAVALHQAPGAGHLLICAATWQSSTATASMSDPNNGTWTAIGSARTGTGGLSGYRGQMFYVPSTAAAATTVTMTVSSAVVFRAFECAEYSYTGTITTPDGAPQYSTTRASGGVATVGGMTTANSSDLVVAGCIAVDTTCAAGTGYVGRNDTNAYDAATKKFGNSFLDRTGQLIEDTVGVAPGAQSATFRTGTSTDNVILGLLAF
jgi:hypothetical protein